MEEKALVDPSYIFCANPGRAGSLYLWRVLSCARNVRGGHEPLPLCQRESLWAWNNGDTTPMEREWEEKRSIIDRVVSGGNVWAETSNAFIKGFGWLATRDLDLDRMALIVLRRNPKHIASSLRRLGFDPRSEVPQNAWMGKPAQEGRDIVSDSGSRMDEINAYILDVERMTHEWLERHPSVQRHDVYLHEIQTSAGCAALLMALGLEDIDMAKLKATAGRPVN